MSALVLCRFAHFMAVMLAFGASAYLALAAPAPLRRALSPPVRRLALIASLVALMTAILWLAFETASMADDWSAAIDLHMIRAVIADTAFGHAWLARLVLAAGLVAALLYGDAGTEEAEPKSGFAKATKAPQQTAGDL